jgi:TonB-linked SusC/RagA family outer membrane protein
MNQKYTSVSFEVPVRVRVLCLTLLLTFSLSLSKATSTISQTIENTFVSINARHDSLEEVFKMIEYQTIFKFVFPPEFVKIHLIVEIGKKSVKEILDSSILGTKLNYTVKDHTITIYYKRTNLNQSSSISEETLRLYAIKGKVTDFKTGSPLPGVNVLVKNTTNGTSTDSNGVYFLDVDDKDVLVFSFIGYKSFEITVEGRSVIDAALEEDVESLDEVVIKAGYWDVNPQINTGNISRVNTDVISKQPVANPIMALTGRMPGVYVQQTSGVPGGAVNIQIRGRNSISNGTDPLYVVDGVPFSSQTLSSSSVSNIFFTSGVSPLNSINPSDIESIEVLKDADATSIYGSRGSNGVVLITTKKGKSGKTILDINLSHGVGKITRMLDLLNTEQYIAMRREGFKNDDALQMLDNPDYNRYWPDVKIWDTTRYTDWQKVLIGGTAHTDNFQASLSGGSSTTNFSISANYYKESTVFPGSQSYKRGSSHFSVAHSSSDNRLNANISVSYVLDRNNLPFTDLTMASRTLAPNAPKLYDEKGNLNWEDNTWINPLSEVVREYEANGNNLITNAVFSYRIVNGLELKANLGYNNKSFTEITIIPISSMSPSPDLTSASSISLNNSSSLQSYIIEPQILYNKSTPFGNLSFLGGTSFQEQKSDVASFMAMGFTSDALIKNSNNASFIDVLNDDYSEYRYNGFFSRINYNYKDRYIVNLTGRRDGSSRFGPDRQFANFGAVGLAWVFSNENWKKSSFKFMNYGKVRGSYGTSGNDQIGNYKYFDTYTSNYPYQGMNGLVPTRLLNPDLAWEVNRKFEVALELGFFSDRIFLSTSYFNNRSSNQLIEYKLPLTTGFNSIQYNLAATVVNRGLEIEIQSQNLQGNSFSWTTSFNATIPRNELVRFPGLASSSYAELYSEGRSLNINKVYAYEGVDPVTGVYKFTDFNDDGAVTLSDDRKKIVDLGQSFYGGVGNKFSFVGFEVDFFIQFVKQTARNYWGWGLYPGGFSNQPAVVMDRWQNEGDVRSIQKFSAGYGVDAGAGNTRISQSDFAISDASFVRLKTFAISYQIPQTVINKFNCKLSIQGQNILTVTDFNGFDPESQSADNLPPLRVWSFGVQLKF